jgi:heme/copper-type cytochrome/quinol oxidase subunit 2
VDGLVVLIEILLVFGLVIGLAFWELRKVRRAQRRDEDDRLGRG